MIEPRSFRKSLVVYRYSNLSTNSIEAIYASAELRSSFLHTPEAPHTKLPTKYIYKHNGIDGDPSADRPATDGHFFYSRFFPFNRRSFT
jgi:hypothetical protein